MPKRRSNGCSNKNHTTKKQYNVTASQNNLKISTQQRYQANSFENKRNVTKVSNQNNTVTTRQLQFLSAAEVLVDSTVVEPILSSLLMLISFILRGRNPKCLALSDQKLWNFKDESVFFQRVIDDASNHVCTWRCHPFIYYWFYPDEEPLQCNKNFWTCNKNFLANFQTLLQESSHMLTHLSVNCERYFPSDIVKLEKILAKQLPHMSQLECLSITNRESSLPFSFRTVYPVSLLRNLKVLHLCNVPGLKLIQLLTDLGNNCPSLKALYLLGCYFQKENEEEEESETMMISLNSLEELHLSANFSFERTFMKHHVCFPNVLKLFIEDCPMHDGKEFSKIFPKLETLNDSSCSGCIHYSVASTIISSCRRLETYKGGLSLSSEVAIDAILDSIHDHPSIKYIDLRPRRTYYFGQYEASKRIQEKLNFLHSPKIKLLEILIIILQERKRKRRLINLPMDLIHYRLAPMLFQFDNL